MKTLYKNVRAYQLGGSFKRADLIAENGTLSVAENPQSSASNPQVSTVIDGSDFYAIPALVDIHTHGCAGFDWMSADADGIRKMCGHESAAGVTSVCPSTISAPLNDIEAAVKRIMSFRRADTTRPAPTIKGINIEGPFLSPKKAGAHNPATLRAPDIAFMKRLADISDGAIKLVSIAPELPGATEFIREVSACGIVCSVAHTTADYECAKAAFDAGARHVTHLFNAMPPFNHREPSVIGAAADNPGVTVELICDGMHLHPSVVRAAFKIFGADRIAMISDSMEATGLPDGAYTLGGYAVDVVGREARLRDGGALAGSVSTLMDCLRIAVKEMGLPLADVVRAAAETPSRVISLTAPQNTLLLDAHLNLIPYSF